jgi:hypothetical protein
MTEMFATARAKLVQKAETDQDMLDLLSALQKVWHPAYTALGHASIQPGSCTHRGPD